MPRAPWKLSRGIPQPLSNEINSMRGALLFAMMVIVVACQGSGSPTRISADEAGTAALAAFGQGHDAKVIATRLSTFGAEAPMSETSDPTTVVWAVSLSGTFEPGSCGPAPATTETLNPCPSPLHSARVLIDATTGEFLLASVPDPGASVAPSEPTKSTGALETIAPWLAPGGLPARSVDPSASSGDIRCPGGGECPPGYTAPPN
jgi:hypothetical protein